MTETASEAVRLRRGVGIVYVLAGLLQWGVLAGAWLRLPAPMLSRLFFGQFLFLIFGGLTYLTASFARTGRFIYHPLVDYLIGVAIFVVLLSFVALILAKGLAGPWLAPAPGLFLIWYGVKLR